MLIYVEVQILFSNVKIRWQIPYERFGKFGKTEVLGVSKWFSVNSALWQRLCRMSRHFLRIDLTSIICCVVVCRDSFKQKVHKPDSKQYCTCLFLYEYVFRYIQNSSLKDDCCSFISAIRFFKF